MKAAINSALVFATSAGALSLIVASACGGEEFAAGQTGGTSSGGTVATGATGGAAGTPASGGAGTAGAPAGGGSGGVAGSPNGGGAGAPPGGSGGVAGAPTTCASPSGPNACEGLLNDAGVVTLCNQVTNTDPPITKPGPGCADGDREGFFDATKYPSIAACAGGWSVPGLEKSSDESHVPECKRASGNSGTNHSGSCCTVEDLCADGWHVCRSADEVLANSSGAGCDMGGASPGFYATRQGTTGSPPVCDSVGVNNVIGCNAGSTIGTSPPSNCGGFGTLWRREHCCCAMNQGWWCNVATTELVEIRKDGPIYGGVVCCKDG